MKRISYYFALISICLSGLQAHAQSITYVDAVADASLGVINTTGPTGFYEPNGTFSGIDNKWARRSDPAPFGNGADDILQYLDPNANSAPEITTQITGLTPGTEYEIFAFFWDADGAQAWSIDAGLQSGNLQTFQAPDSTGTVTDTTSGLASNLTFTSNVITSSGNRTMHYASLGDFIASGSGTIDVFIDNSISANSNPFRTWYDGVGYREKAEVVSLYVDANESNTVASGGSPSPFSTSVETTGNLWRKRTGFGFDVNNNTEIYEKDTSNGVGDAALLETTISGLNPGQEYGVYACFLSVASENWQVQAGLSASNLINLNPNTGGGRITDLGLSSVTNSNRNQYLGFVGNQTADVNGEIVAFIDDGDGGGSSSRTWYEGVAIGAPVTLPEPPPLPGGSVEIAPDGVWTWFNDERAIYHQGFLYSGYVRSDGHVGLTRYNPETGESLHTQLSTNQAQEVDDHNNLSITVLPDNKLLVVYSRHNTQSRFYWRISNTTTPGSLSDWGTEQSKSTPAANTYSNTYRLSGESNRIYNFHRSTNFDPCISISNDNGQTFGNTIHMIDAGNGGQRPYPRYVSNGVDQIDFIYTDGHPRGTNNSVYHMYYNNNAFYKTDGTLISTFANLPIDHDLGERGSVIYQYNGSAWGPGDGPDDWIPQGRGWTWDIHYGSDGHPVCVFQVQIGGSGGFTTDRIFYYYARWTGTEWQKRFIAQAGHGIYNAERDYGGGMTIDPEDPRIVYISSNAVNPFNLSSISSSSIPINPNSRYEIYRGFTADGGLTFEWTPITANSEQNNLRPIVPQNHGRVSNLVWFTGQYTTYLNYNCKVVGLFGEESDSLDDWKQDNGLANADLTLDSDSDGLSDLLEYSFGSNPNSAADAEQPKVVNGAFSFKQYTNRTGAEAIVQMSPDLSPSSWDDIATIRPGVLPNNVNSGVSLQSVGENPTTYTLDLDPQSNGSKMFMRVKVQQVP